ncbi:MAG: tetratricopeptide repeat protein [Candidatus Omnitrophica bacterium]|jgi:tetratricopeptide (TPR) repeat protein|nr:tetratricopeptide repeat protein [Candidatus Omnitrophota bacterium]
MRNVKLFFLIFIINIVFINTANTQIEETNPAAGGASRISPDTLYKDYIEQGLYYFEKNQLNQAKYLFYNAKELMPDRADSYINLAAIAMKRKNFAKAIIILEKAGKLPDETKQDVIFCNLGMCLQKLSKYPEAINYYSKAISINPVLGEALLNRGMLYLKNDKTDLALIDILKARVIFREQGRKDIVRSCDEMLFPITKKYAEDKNLAEKLLREGSLSFENKRNEEAIALLKVSILLGPDNQEGYYRLGVVYTNSKKFDEALDCFSKTIKLNPENVSAYMNMGAIFGELKKYDQALSALHKALNLEKNNPKIYYNIAMVHISNANKKEAASYLKKAKALAAKKRDPRLLQRIDEAYKTL